MQGLVSYTSSDDEDGRPQDDQHNAESMDVEFSEDHERKEEKVLQAKPGLANVTKSSDAKPDTRPKDEATELENGKIVPAIGPSGPPQPADLNTEGSSAPQSPYLAERALLRNLSLPTVPDLDIPPSPPGSPSAASSAKFANFRKLKQQGTHFNERLAQSPALRNPGFASKLMDFAGITSKDQYASALPVSLWDPAGLPTWAHKDGLAQMQKDVSRKREEKKSREQREAIEFVPSINSGDSGRGGTLSTSGKSSGQSAAERIMSGLDREKPKSPYVGATRRGEPERKSRKLENGNGLRSQSRSPQRARRRSRSR